MKKQNEFYCWYSPKQAKVVGEVIYLIDGINKKVTVVSNSLDHGCLFDDLVFLGRGTFIERLTKGVYHGQTVER